MVTRSTRGRALAGLLATMILGCSNAEDGGDGPIAAGEFIPAAAAGICDDVGDCCEQDGYPFSAASCRRVYTTAIEERLARGTVVYDADAAGRCVRALRASPGRCDTTSEEFEACSAVFRGTVPAGGECVEGADCVGSFGSALCLSTGVDDRQVCTEIQPEAPPMRASLGDACRGTCRADSRYPCANYGPEQVAICFTDDGLYCSYATSTCASLLPEGGACALGEKHGCVPGTFCEHGRCVPVRDAGASCVVDACMAPFGCPSPSDDACGTGLVCSIGSEDPRCIAPQPDGSACTAARECTSGWCELDCNQQSCASVGYCDRPKRTTRDQCIGATASVAHTASVAGILGLR